MMKMMLRMMFGFENKLGGLNIYEREKTKAND